MAALLARSPVLMRRHAWLLFALADAALLIGLGMWLDWPILFALAPLSFPAWAWLNSKPEGRALLDRFFRS